MPPTTHESIGAPDWPGSAATGPNRPPPAARLDDAILALVAQHVVPRLVVAHTHQVIEPWAASHDPAETAKVHRFVNLLLAPDIDDALDHAAALRCSGVHGDLICLGLLAPAARRLHDLWRDEACDYAGLTLGLWRLHVILHQLDSASIPLHGLRRENRAVLLVTMPGERATFEHSLVESFFRRSGWLTHNHVATSASHLAAIVQGLWFQVAWVSTNAATRRNELASCINALRGGSRTRTVGIVWGGALVETPPSPWLVGADAIVPDAHSAMAITNRWRLSRSE